MESNLPVIAKKFWNMVRVMYFMLRKGISKSKLMVDLNMMMKRGKIAGKALQNLMFHHGHSWASTSAAAFTAHRRSSHHHHDRQLDFPVPPNEYEFSCSNSPAFFNFHINKRSKHNKTADDFVSVNAAVMKALEMLNSEPASPALPGFGKSPMVRQLRVTDSPFPLSCVDEDNHVDAAAEEFIMKFYSDLRRENAMGRS